MSILLDTLRKYPHLFINDNPLAVFDDRMCKVLIDNLSCADCILCTNQSPCRCLGYYEDNPNLPADLAELRQSNPELFI